MNPKWTLLKRVHCRTGSQADGAHAVLILDQAGWHLTPKLSVPENIRLLFLPPRSPELNPVENVWQSIRDNWLSTRIFTDYEEIVALGYAAWNKLVAQPWKIISHWTARVGASILINACWGDVTLFDHVGTRRLCETSGGCAGHGFPLRHCADPMDVDGEG
uniref:transposase n=1 Tax=Rhizobium meliloti TaxID=382 RepID=UPI0035ABF64C